MISRNPDYRADGVEVIDSVDAALALLAGSDVAELMVIGAVISTASCCHGPTGSI